MTFKKLDNNNGDDQETLKNFINPHILQYCGELITKLCELDPDNEELMNVQSDNVKCDTCDGDGDVECGNCEGQDADDCDDCDDDGLSPCPDCDGQGSTNYEALEFIIVSDWFGEQLKKFGELVQDIHGLTVWGRTTSGQAIYMDGLIQNMYNNIYKD